MIFVLYSGNSLLITCRSLSSKSLAAEDESAQANPERAREFLWMAAKTHLNTAFEGLGFSCIGSGSSSVSMRKCCVTISRI